MIKSETIKSSILKLYSRLGAAAPPFWSSGRAPCLGCHSSLGSNWSTTASSSSISSHLAWIPGPSASAVFELDLLSHFSLLCRLPATQHSSPYSFQQSPSLCSLSLFWLPPALVSWATHQSSPAPIPLAFAWPIAFSSLPSPAVFSRLVEWIWQ